MIAFQVGIPLMLVLSTARLNGQEVAYLDLVGVKPRTELRSPPVPPPVCKEDGTCTVTGNSFGSVSCGGTARGERRALKTTLVSLDRFAYTPDDSAEIEIRIENVGIVNISIPWSPHLADLQPEDEKQSFQYSSLAIMLELTRSQVDKHREIIEAAKLYGTARVPSSLTVLKPGQLVRLRVKTELAVSSKKLQDEADYQANLAAELRSEVFIPNLSYGGYSTDVANEYPQRVYGPDLLLHIIKVRSEK